MATQRREGRDARRSRDTGGVRRPAGGAAASTAIALLIALVGIALVGVALVGVTSCGDDDADGSELRELLIDLGSSPPYADCLARELPDLDPPTVARIVEANTGAGYPELVEGVDDDELDAFLAAHRKCSDAS